MAEEGLQAQEDLALDWGLIITPGSGVVRRTATEKGGNQGELASVIQRTGQSGRGPCIAAISVPQHNMHVINIATLDLPRAERAKYIHTYDARTAFPGPRK